MRIRQLDVDGPNAEDRDDDRLFNVAGHTIIMERARGAFDKTAGGNRHSPFGIEVGAAVHPPRPRQDHLDAIGGVAVRGAEPTRIPLPQDEVRPPASRKAAVQTGSVNRFIVPYLSRPYRKYATEPDRMVLIPIVLALS